MDIELSEGETENAGESVYRVEDSGDLCAVRVVRGDVLPGPALELRVYARLLDEEGKTLTCAGRPVASDPISVTIYARNGTIKPDATLERTKKVAVEKALELRSTLELWNNLPADNGHIID